MKVIEIPAPITVRLGEDAKAVKEISFPSFLMAHMDVYTDVKTVSQIREATALAAAIDAAKDTLVIEKSQFDLLSGAVAKTAYLPAVSRQLLPFWDAIEAAKEYTK